MHNRAQSYTIGNPRLTASVPLLRTNKNKDMDKVFKNNTFMGIVSLATLAIVIVLLVKGCDTDDKKAKEE